MKVSTLERIITEFGSVSKEDYNAAVALLISRGKILFIKRQINVNDRWSGQVAFPGGKREDRDKSPFDTAARELYEETKIKDGYVFLGYLPPFYTTKSNVKVIPVVLYSKYKSAVKINIESSSYKWIRLSSLYKGYSVSKDAPGREGLETDCYIYKDYIIWGLTYRILSFLKNLISLP